MNFVCFVRFVLNPFFDTRCALAPEDFAMMRQRAHWDRMAQEQARVIRAA